MVEKETIHIICTQIDVFNRTGKLPTNGETDPQSVNIIPAKGLIQFSTYFQHVGIWEETTEQYYIPKGFTALVDDLYEDSIGRGMQGVRKRRSYKFTSKQQENRKKELSVIVAYYYVFMNQFMHSAISYRSFEAKKKDLKYVDPHFAALEQSRKCDFTKFEKMQIELVPKNTSTKKIRINFANTEVIRDIILYAYQREISRLPELTFTYPDVQGENEDQIFEGADQIFNAIDLHDPQRSIKVQLFYAFTMALYNYVKQENIITYKKAADPISEICKFIVAFYCTISLAPTPTQAGNKKEKWEYKNHAKLSKKLRRNIARFLKYDESLNR